MNFLYFIIILLSFLFDILFFVFGIGNIFNIEKIKDLFVLIDGNFPLFIFCIVSIVFSLIFFLFGFISLGQSGGDNPCSRRSALSLFFKSSIKMISSIISFIIFIVLKGKGKIILYIFASIISIILIFYIGNLIYKLIKFIINKIHGI